MKKEYTARVVSAPKLTEAQRAMLADLATKGGHIVSWGTLRRSLRRDALIDANGYITDAGRAALRGKS